MMKIAPVFFPLQHQLAHLTQQELGRLAHLLLAQEDLLEDRAPLGWQNQKVSQHQVILNSQDQYLPRHHYFHLG